MKKVISLIIAFMMLFLCACSDSEKDSSKINYTNERVFTGVRMDIPEGYVKNDDDPQHPYYIKDAKELETFYTITITTEKTDSTFDSYSYYAKSKYEKLYGYILFSEQNAEINGVNAKILEFQYKVEYDTGDETFYCAAGIFVNATDVYVVTCISSKWAYDLEREAFLHCINSLNI